MHQIIGIYTYILKFGFDDIFGLIQSVMIVAGFAIPSVTLILLHGEHRRIAWLATVAIIAVEVAASAANAILY